MKKITVVIFSVFLLASVFVIAQNAFAQQNEPAYKSPISAHPWLLSLILPDGWDEKKDLPFYYASAETEGDPVIVGYVVPTQKTFPSRDNLHSHLKSTEYLAIGQFGLSNSITTMDTSYGHKTIIQYKFQKNDGEQVLIRKDFHYITKEHTLYSVQGFSSDAETFEQIEDSLNRFKPSV